MDDSPVDDTPRIVARLQEFLATDILATGGDRVVDPDADLVALGLDSFALLRLVLFLETEFGVDVGGEDILGEGLGTVREIAAHVAARRA